MLKLLKWVSKLILWILWCLKIYYLWYNIIKQQLFMLATPPHMFPEKKKLKHIVPQSYIFSQLQLCYCRFIYVTGSPFFFLNLKQQLRKFKHKNDCLLVPFFGSGKVIIISVAKRVVEHRAYADNHYGPGNKVQASFSMGWQPHFSI